MKRDRTEREIANYSQKEGMKMEETFLIRDILHFWNLETLIHLRYLL